MHDMSSMQLEAVEEIDAMNSEDEASSESSHNSGYDEDGGSTPPSKKLRVDESSKNQSSLGTAKVRINPSLCFLYYSCVWNIWMISYCLSSSLR
jgi:hypothetical protein